MSDCDQLTHDPELWNSDEYIKYNNCYRYAMNDPDPELKDKTMPGELCGEDIQRDQYECAIIEEAMRCDYGGGALRPHSCECDQPCPCGQHKIYLAIDNEGENRDFHFYRQDLPNCGWSHKPGSTRVQAVDKSGAPITDPRTADRGSDHTTYNYEISCGCYCVDSNV